MPRCPCCRRQLHRSRRAPQRLRHSKSRRVRSKLNTMSILTRQKWHGWRLRRMRRRGWPVVCHRRLKRTSSQTKSLSLCQLSLSSGESCHSRISPFVVPQPSHPRLRLLSLSTHRSNLSHFITCHLTSHPVHNSVFFSTVDHNNC